MTLTITATYENGVLKPEQPLPLNEHEKVQVTVHTEPTLAQRTSGLLGWKGNAATVEFFALNPELDPQEAP
jgi:predicted DNA-binding antitoxin AbrB/MazE fold protein